MDDIEVFKQVFPEKYFYEFWLKDRRPDNRSFTEIRKTTITRSGASGFILNSGGNVVQTTYEIQQTKVKINTDAKSTSELLYDKIAIQFAQEVSFPLFAPCVDHLKRILIKKYAEQLKSLKLHERILIDISALFFDVSLLNSVMLSAVIALYECFIYKCKIQFESIELLFPLVVKAFMVPEKDALLWLWDPSKEELILNPSSAKPAVYFTIISLESNKVSIEKLEGCDMSFDDLANLAELFRETPDRALLKSSLSSYLRQIAATGHRIV